MCLLVKQSVSTQFDDDFLAGVYNRNSDGLGVMFSEGNKLVIRKFLPKTEKQFIQFYRNNIEGRDCAWHARMRTHGDIDMDNCHPYPVLTKDDGYPLYLAHNGVLHTGNFANTKKSDTWHFIQDFLRPMLVKNPEFFLHPSFEELIGEYIGSGNKFVLMDALGNSVVINEKQGVSYNNAWLSNTYAWDTSGTPFQARRSQARWGSYNWPTTYNSPYSFGGLNDDENDPYGWEAYKKELADAEAKDQEELEPAVNISELCLEYCCEFFDTLRELEYNEDSLSWDDVEKFYVIAGSEAAYELLDDMWHETYDEQTCLDIIHSFIDPSITQPVEQKVAA